MKLNKYSASKVPINTLTTGTITSALLDKDFILFLENNAFRSD